MYDAIEPRRPSEPAVMRLPSRDGPGRRRRFGTEALDELAGGGLLGRVLWSTTCGVADVVPGDLGRLVEAGLFSVRLDLEPRPGSSPRHLLEHQRCAVGAVQTLRRLGILVEYDFDLVGPLPRFAGVQERIRFLRALVCDGSTPAFFSRPPSGASCSPWLAAFLADLDAVLEVWFGPKGMSTLLAEAWADLTVNERILRGPTGVAAHRIALQRLTMRSNTGLLDLVASAAADYERDGRSERLELRKVTDGCAALGHDLGRLCQIFADTRAQAMLAGGFRA